MPEFPCCFKCQLLLSTLRVQLKNVSLNPPSFLVSLSLRNPGVQQYIILGDEIIIQMIHQIITQGMDVHHVSRFILTDSGILCHDIVPYAVQVRDFTQRASGMLLGTLLNCTKFSAPTVQLSTSLLGCVYLGVLVVPDSGVWTGALLWGFFTGSSTDSLVAGVNVLQVAQILPMTLKHIRMRRKSFSILSRSYRGKDQWRIISRSMLDSLTPSHMSRHWCTITGMSNVRYPTQSFSR